MKKISWLLSGIVVSTVFIAICLFERNVVMGLCGGEYVYPIDDTYIHIAMAKHVACEGTWGVESGKLAFCSSSPLWTLLLGGLYYLFGVSDTLPWFLALLFNVGLLFVVCRTLAYVRAGFMQQLIGSVCTAVAGPILCTTALGMEHAMHAFFIIATLASAFAMTRGSRFCRVITPLLAAAATASRYESLFLLLPIGGFLALVEMFQGWKEAGKVALPKNGPALILAAILPVLTYGCWALCCGGHFFPNSLLLKGGFNTPAELFEKAIRLFGSVKPGWGFLYVLALALSATAVLKRTPLVWRLFAASAVIALCGHMLLADVGQLCRYEAYLTTLGMFIIFVGIADAGLGPFPMAYVPIGIVSVMTIVFFFRAHASFSEIIHGSSDIYCQQVLMTRLLSGLPPDSRGCVALNDLGYMALHGNFPILDIWGLGSQDATELVLANGKRWAYDAHETLFKKHDVKYVVVFETWFPLPLMPKGTIDVAKMKLTDNLVCGSDTVVFRATSPEYADRLEHHLMNCTDKLPPRAKLTFCR